MRNPVECKSRIRDVGKRQTLSIFRSDLSQTCFVKAGLLGVWKLHPSHLNTSPMPCFSNKCILSANLPLMLELQPSRKEVLSVEHSHLQMLAAALPDSLLLAHRTEDRATGPARFLLGARVSMAHVLSQLRRTETHLSIVRITSPGPDIK